MKTILRYSRFFIMANYVVGQAIAATLVRSWLRLRPLCSYCTHAVDLDSIVRGESVMWCAHCRRPTPRPFAKAPGWVIGTIGTLAINAMRISWL